MPTEHSPQPFSTVLAEELEAIRERRRCLQDDVDLADSQPLPTDVSQPEQVESIEDVRRRALAENLVGLSFSGGGIRSATFNLGILQGLADLGLLTQFDYLSTVSGGGYIGSWLAAWVKREGCAANVERQLQSSRIRQAEATRHGLPAGEVFDAEPEPIHHLRSFSNYLTPRLGLLSVDTWVLASIYIRNLLLNLLVLVPLMLALIMSERLLMMLFIMTTDNQNTGEWEIVVWITGQVTMVVMLVMVFLWTHRSILQIRSSYQGTGQAHDYHSERRYLHRFIMLPLLTLGVLLTWLAHAHFQWFADPANEKTLALLPQISAMNPSDREWLTRLLAGTVMAIVVGAFHLLVGFDPSQKTKNAGPIKRMIFRLERFSLGLLVGFVGGMALYEVFMMLQSFRLNGRYGSVIALTFGPPLFLTVLILIAFFQVGLISRLWSESIREWWSSVAGTTMIYLFTWLGIFGLSIWGPWMVLMLEQQIRGSSTILGAGWVTSIVSGMMASRNAAQGTTSRLKAIFLKVIPVVFLVGLLILTSFVTDYFVPPWGFATTPEQYLQSVEQTGGSAAVPGQQQQDVSSGPIAPTTASKLDLILKLIVTIAVMIVLTAFASSRIDVNTFSLNALYQNRLARCYLGASRPKASAADGGWVHRGAPTNVINCSARSPNPITGFDPNDDFPLAELRVDSHLRNARKRSELEQSIREIDTLLSNLGRTAWLTRGWRRLWCRWKRMERMNQLDALHVENCYVGPLPILSTALNLVGGGELAWQERMAESFALTPFYCGSITTGYAPTETYAGGITLAKAVAISGAAVSPNMGYHSRHPITALLTIFNLRLGAWLGNPRLSTWKDSGPKNLLRYLVNELFGLTNADRDYIYLSDGGHFENLGLYELLRRRCRFIVACDSGADPNFEYADLAGLIRKARIDFGLKIVIDTLPITPQSLGGLSPCHAVVGRIFYGDIDGTAESASSSTEDESKSETDPAQFRPENNEGLLIYIKPGVTGDEPQDVLNYRQSHPLFPHEPTTDQWFSESQFESYRALGWYTARKIFTPVAGDLPTAAGIDRSAVFERLLKQWPPPISVVQTVTN